MDYNIMDIKEQINCMIYLNIMSYSVLSGAGNFSMPSRTEIEELEHLLQAVTPENRPYNINFVHGLYKKAMPQYEGDIENPYNFNNFLWIEKKRKNIIDVDVISNSIISCCNLIERLLTFDMQLENPNFIIYILQKTAVNQAMFIKNHLQVGNMFYNGEDISEQDGEEMRIQIAADKPDRVSQFAVMHAFSALVQVSSYNLYYLNSSDSNYIGDLSILPNLVDSLSDDIENSSSKELTLIGLHLTEIYKKAGCYNDGCRKTLYRISKELCKRVKENGELRRGIDELETASPVTALNGLNLLSQLAYMFASKSCYEAAHKLYQLFASTWDDSGRIFKLKDSNKQSYNIKVVAATLAALFSLSRIVHDQTLRTRLNKQIIGFTDTTLIKSGLFNGQCYPILQNGRFKCLEAIKYEKNWAPVFNKAFEYKISKKKFYCDADVFRADYVLPACAIMLESINS